MKTFRPTIECNETSDETPGNEDCRPMGLSPIPSILGRDLGVISPVHDHETDENEQDGRPGRRKPLKPFPPPHRCWCSRRSSSCWCCLGYTCEDLLRIQPIPHQ